VLNISSGIHDLGGLNWELVLCLLLDWVCVFLVLLRGIKTFGKVDPQSMFKLFDFKLEIHVIVI